jgi:zinc and cadmium transporter
MTYFASLRLDLELLVPVAAGNFLYIAASDLVPEVNRHLGPRRNLEHFFAFLAGLGLLYLLRSPWVRSTAGRSAAAL